MKKPKIFLIVLLSVLCLFALLAFTACGDSKNNRPSCGVESTVGFEIDKTGDIPRLYCEVPYTTQYIDISNKITVTNGCTWKLYKDFLGATELILKSMSLEVGHNTAYVIVYVSADVFVRYEVDIYRLDMKSYTFKNVYTIYQAGTVEEKSSINAPKKNPEMVGYTFIGWAVEGSSKIIEFPYTVTENITFIAQYAPINYTITYHLNGGENAEDNPKSYNIQTTAITLLPATRAYYTFGGWYSDGDFQTQVTVIKLGSYGDKELYAKWIPIEYDIIYHLNGGVNAEGNPQSYNIESDTITLLPAIYTGSIFAGWYSDEQLNTQVTTIEHGSHGNKDLYAKWKIANYTITYHLNGGTNAEGNPQSYTMWTRAITLLSATRTDYTFMGWYKDALFNEQITNIAFGSYGDLNLYAKWNYGTEGLTYFLSGGEYMVTGYNGASTNVIIPEEWNGYKVTSIGEDAFRRCTSLENITIPDSITSIGENAFDNCKSLVSITIPDSVTSIGSGAFFVCTNLESVTIGNGVTSIGSAAFLDCTGIKNITLGVNSNLTSIGERAFSNCTGITSINIPDGVTSIGDSAFDGCKNLNAVYITDLVSWCNIDFGDEFANPLYYAHNLYVNNNLVTELEIPNSVTSIGDYAFYNCTDITSITISDGVTSIGSDAFYGCESLEIVYWNATNCTRAGWKGYYTSSNFMFGNCSALTTLIIGDNVQTIPYYAFLYCRSLTSIIIGNSVTSIGGEAFSGCTGITSIIIPDSVTSIGTYAFSNCTGITSIIIPDSVTYIGSDAFRRCTSLTSIIIGNNVTYISSDTFRDCTSLTSITIPDGVTSIGIDAFNGCTNLTSITIPISVGVINHNTFDYCTSLKNVYYGGTAEQWDEIRIISDNNDNLLSATRYYYSEEYPYNDEITEGNFWHYDDVTGEIDIWVKQ